MGFQPAADLVFTLLTLDPVLLHHPLPHLLSFKRSICFFSYYIVFILYCINTILYSYYIVRGCTEIISNYIVRGCTEITIYCIQIILYEEDVLQQRGTTLQTRTPPTNSLLPPLGPLYVMIYMMMHQCTMCTLYSTIAPCPRFWGCFFGI